MPIFRLVLSALKSKGIFFLQYLITLHKSAYWERIGGKRAALFDSNGIVSRSCAIPCSQRACTGFQQGSADPDSLRRYILTLPHPSPSCVSLPSLAFLCTTAQLPCRLCTVTPLRLRAVATEDVVLVRRFAISRTSAPGVGRRGSRK